MLRGWSNRRLEKCQVSSRVESSFTADLSSSIVEIFNFPHIKHNTQFVGENTCATNISSCNSLPLGVEPPVKCLVSCEVESSFMLDSSSSIGNIFHIPYCRYIEDADVNEYMSNKHLSATVCLQGSSRRESASSAAVETSFRMDSSSSIGDIYLIYPL